MGIKSCRAVFPGLPRLFHLKDEGEGEGERGRERKKGARVSERENRKEGRKVVKLESAKSIL